MNRNIFFAGISTLIIFSTCSSPVTALSFLDNPQCKTYEEQIDIRVRDYGDKKDQQVRAFLDIKQELSFLAADLKRDGGSTNKLTQDLSLIDQKTDLMSVQYTTLKNQLASTKNLDCQKDKAKIEKLLGNAKGTISDLKNTSQDIQNWYKTQIKNDLIALEKR